MAEQEELKPCPFCGRSDKISVEEDEIHNGVPIDDGKPYFCVICRNCWVMTICDDDRTPEQAIAHWNRRC